MRSPIWDNSKGCDDPPSALQLNCGRTNQTDFRYCECCPRQSRLTHTEGRTMLSLWYIGRSPLMFGTSKLRQYFLYFRCFELDAPSHA